MESKISIPKPCNENWSAMSPTKKGRFCNSCDKTVIDFTKMNNPEILKYFSENSDNERICGHFKLSQIEDEESSKYNILKKRFSRIQIKPIKSAAMFSLSLLFSLSSCMGKARIESESTVNSNDSINENDKFVKKNVEVKNDSTTIERKQIKH
jgi:hypothetical protein